jgi:hypothetical protein
MQIMKRIPQAILFTLVIAMMIPLLNGCGSLPKHIPVETRVAEPPPGKVLVNFQRPSSYGGGLYPIFDGNGKFLCDLPVKACFQYICDPGEHVFIGWAERVSVVKADVEADKVYDIMVDAGMGWVRANIFLTPLQKDNKRRAELEKFEKREKYVVGITRTDHVINYEETHQDDIEEIKRDFLTEGGPKSDRVEYLRKEDHR